MKLTLGDKVYESDLTALPKVSIGEAREIKRQTGMTIGDWEVGLKDLGRVDPDVLAALVFLLRSRAGETVDWSEIDVLSADALAEGLDFALTEVDRERIAAAGAKDWAELEAVQAQAADGEQLAPVDASVEKPTEKPATEPVTQ